MINCIILAIILLILLIINFILLKKDVIEPAFIFNTSFFVSSFTLIFASAKWKVDISFITILTIVFSVIFFSLICYCIKHFFKKNKKKCIIDNKKNEIIDIKKGILIAFIIFSIVIIVLTIYYTVKAVDGDFKHIGAALYKYRNYVLRYKYDVNFPLIIDLLGGIVHASSYYFVYIFIHNYMINKKVNILLLIIIIITGTSTVLDGTRGAIINIILTFIPLFFILYYNCNKKKIKINKKIITILTLVTIVFLTQFQKTALILGRNDVKDFNNSDYIYIYLGAPIYNLDTFLNQKILDEKYIGIHTFSSVYDIFGKFVPENRQSFKVLNGNNLGNVYTILFDFICDGKFIGLLLGIIIMATISQTLYEIILNKVEKNEILNKPSILILIYAYIFGGLVFSFFGNKFFAQIFNFSFVKYLILWYLINIILFERKRYLK